MASKQRKQMKGREEGGGEQKRERERERGAGGRVGSGGGDGEEGGCLGKTVATEKEKTTRETRSKGATLGH
jgi:hypothetical protein